MKRLLIGAIAFALGTIPAAAQGLDDLNVQIHGYATQAYIYTNHNNWNTADTSDGTAKWTEIVMNLTALPAPKLRIAVQARYFLLGSYGNNISLDYGQADYKINEFFGVRAGKVKTPSGLFNESQDIDPAHVWILLPQSVYPISSRTTLLSHYGGVVYGTVPVGERFGKFQYRGFGGEQIVNADDGVLQPERDNGTTFPSGLTGKIYGGTLRYEPPVDGLLFGVSIEHERHVGAIVNGARTGTFDSGPFDSVFYYANYQHRSLMLAAEYNRFPPNPTSTFVGFPPNSNPSDAHNWYLMSTWKFKPKISAGAYYSYSIDLKAPYDQNRYQKDWTLSGRYDVNEFIYLKAEQHFVNGTGINFSALDNSGGLSTKFNMTLVKLGVMF
jgi:hypothetical protein